MRTYKHPAEMTPEERLEEVAEILAEAFWRVKIRRECAEGLVGEPEEMSSVPELAAHFSLSPC